MAYTQRYGGSGPVSKLIQFLKRFKSDQRAIGWVFGVAVIALGLMALIYFPLRYAWDQICLWIIGTYTFSGMIAAAYTVVTLIITYMLVFGVVFLVNWMIVQAKARSYDA